MSDSRDTNHDGKVSLMEKVKDKLHLGHKGKDTEYTSTHTTTAHHTAGGRDLNHDGHISTSERLASTSGFSDSRDLNRDGHISASERLASEKLGASHHGLREDEARLKLHEEQLAISKREVGAGEVDIHKRVMEERVQQTIPVRREEVTVERRALHGAAEPGARIAAQDEVVRMPLFREEVIAEKRIVPTEEVIVRKKEIIDNQAVGATLRSEYVETMQTGATHHTGMAGTHDSLKRTNATAFDSRDKNLDGHVSMGEKMNYDANRDGHVSAAEKLKGATGMNQPRAARG